jgi:hypothetical protein
MMKKEPRCGKMLQAAVIAAELARDGVEPVFNGLWTLLHVPCIVLTGLATPAGTPVGAQFVAPRLAARDFNSDRGVNTADMYLAPSGTNARAMLRPMHAPPAVTSTRMLFIARSISPSFSPVASSRDRRVSTTSGFGQQFNGVRSPQMNASLAPDLKAFAGSRSSNQWLVREGWALSFELYAKGPLQR